jgi:DNA replication factor GINS
MTLYDKLYQAWKKESENTEIQTLPRELYANLANYVKKVREESRMLDEKTTKAKLRQLELRNVTKMIHELVQLRYEKAMQRTMNGKTMLQEGLTKEEGKLAEEFSLLTESYQALSQRILRGTLSHVKREEKPRKMLVLFLQDTPAIIGSDMKTYGPFKPENTATLPSENARILIKQGVAVEVEV